jgi:hypothetical protein
MAGYIAALGRGLRSGAYLDAWQSSLDGFCGHRAEKGSERRDMT